MEPDHVRIALTHHHPVGLDDVALGPVQPVQHLRLAVDGRLGRVLVLGRVIAAGQDSSTEGHRLSGLIEDGEQQPGSEGVLKTVAAVDEGEAGLTHHTLGEGQRADQRIPVVRRPSQPEPARQRAVDAAAAEVVAGGAAVRRGEEPLVVPLDGGLHGLQEPLAPLPVAALAAARVAQRDPGLGRQLLDRGGEVQVLHLLDEAEDVAGRPATEAVVSAHLVADVEGTGALGMERAQAHVVASHPLELDVRADHVDQRHRRPDPLDVLLHDRHGRADTTDHVSPARAGALASPGPRTRSRLALLERRLPLVADVDGVVRRSTRSDARIETTSTTMITVREIQVSMWYQRDRIIFTPTNARITARPCCR